MKLILNRECFLCGTLNGELGNICIQCKSESKALNGPFCTICGMELISELNTCLRCRENQYSFINNTSLFEYRGTFKEILYQYKFKNNKIIGYWFAELLMDIIDQKFTNHILIPSPFSHFKMRKKGWDQVDFIVNILQKKYKIEIMKILKKEKIKDQKKQDIHHRKSNIKGSISIKENTNIENMNLLLIDDIFTSGATANECSQILLQNKALSVSILTLAID